MCLRFVENLINAESETRNAIDNETEEDCDKVRSNGAARSIAGD